MRGRRILITDKVHPLLKNGLIDKGAVVDYYPKMPYDDVQQVVSKYDGIIINSKVICNEDFLFKAKHLDFVGRLGSGLDIIDQPYAQEMGVEVISSPEGNANAVGEHALGMLLALLHNISNSHADVKKMDWNREVFRGEALLNKTIGIIGFGHTGPAFAKKLEGLDVTVLAYDKYQTDYTRGYVSVAQSSIEEIQQQSHIISIHLPLTLETRGMIDSSWLHQCRPGTVIINTSRGAILNTKDLLHQLEDGHVGGACLDVLENEKPNTWNGEEREVYGRLLERKDVIITPHIAGWTHQSLKKIAHVLLDKIQAYYLSNG